MFKFDIQHVSGKARAGVLRTSHGEVATPVFMPVGTAGSVKGVTPDQLRAAGVGMVLANTYHLLLRPGPETVAALGGVHAMMGWQGPMLTDSGGYQVFSLAHRRKIDDEGVVFASHIDGSAVELTPRKAVEVQAMLGADVIMQLDECPPADATKEQVAVAVHRSAKWAALCKEAWEESKGEERRAKGETTEETTEGRRARSEERKDNGKEQEESSSVSSRPSPLALRPSSVSSRPSPFAPRPSLFGIQQGGVHLDLRAESAARLTDLDLPGYAIGGLSVGEGHPAMVEVLAAIDDQLPRAKPRYLMGVGEPRDILAAVAAGVDMFDCVLPTRNGRNAQAFTWQGRLRLRNQRHARDRSPLEETCDCYTCRNFSRGTLRHLFMAKEMLGPTLLTIHNLRFFARFTAAIRQAILDGDLPARTATWLDQMYPAEEEV
jgi:queuine tRNA-ribosyltransferase